MGSLTLPRSGVVYVDTQVLIYSIERSAPYSELFMPLWKASERGKVVVGTSELAVLEALVGPMKRRDQHLVDIYEQFLSGTEVQLVPVSRSVLHEAARLRAETSLRTPDAIHAATALCVGCATFLTNDNAFRSLSRLPVQILSDCLA